MANYSDNCFLFLGKTGVGKSLCAKNLTSNPNIIVSDEKESCTSRICGYNAYIPSSLFSNEFKYKVIDTPGLNDSFGRDKNIIDQIKTYFEDRTIKVKGIFIFLNFQDVRFDNAEKDIIKKIYNLVPMDNFWEYVTIIFTNYYAGKFENLEEKRKKADKSFRDSFFGLMKRALFEEGIIPINTNKLRIKYIDLYDPDKFDDPKTRENVINENNNYLNSLKIIFKNLSTKQPLYSKIEVKIIENQKVLDRITESKANLYICKIKKFLYYNQEEKLIKEKGIILDKKYDKDIELNRLEAHSFRAAITTVGAMFAGFGCVIGSCVFPPAAVVLVPAAGALFASETAAGAVMLGTKISDMVENYIFDHTDDISKYEN